MHLDASIAFDRLLQLKTVIAMEIEWAGCARQVDKRAGILRESKNHKPPAIGQAA